jgi:competence protein ComEC
MFRGRASTTALMLTVLLIAGGWFTLRIRTPDLLALNSTFARELNPEIGPHLVTVHATILTSPRPADPSPGVLLRFAPTQETRARFLARIRVLETPQGEQLASGDVSVWVSDDSTPLSTLAVAPGQAVRITGLYTPVTPALNPGQPDRERLSRQSGRVGSLSLTSPSLILPVEHASVLDRLSGYARASLWSFRDRASRALDAATPEGPARALVKALILGEPDPALSEASAVFSRLGIVHILSISGFHVSAMALFVSFLVRLLGERGRWQTALLALPIVAYLFLVPAEAPVLRAGVLALVVILAELAARRYDPATLLLWTCVGLLVWRPMDLWSLGYQLSCGMTLALLWIGPLANDRLWGSRVIIPGAWRHVTPLRLALGPLKSAASVSLLCWSLSSPIVAWRTGQVSLLAVVASVLLAPIFAALMYIALAALFVGMLIPPVAAAFSWIVGAFASAALSTAAALDTLPGSSFLAPPIPWWSAALLTGVILWWWVKGRAPSPLAWLAAGLSVAALALGVISATWLPRSTLLRIDTLAVSDGSCHVLRSGPGPGEAILWDCGSLRPGIGTRELPAALRALGIWRVPTAVISHGDFDHYAALPDLAPRIGLRRVLVGERLLARANAAPNGPASALLADLRERGIEVITIAAGHQQRLGDVTLTFISPTPNATWPVENDHSLVARVDQLDGTSFSDKSPALALLTGDIQSAAIASLRDRFPDLKARVVEAPHHGSNRPDAAAWLATLAPEAVVQSTGPTRANARSADVWDDLKRFTRWLTTAQAGAIRTDVPAQGPIRAAPFPRSLSP